MGGRGPDRVDEPYAFECKDRLRQLLVGKQVKVKVDYVRDIPAGENTIKRKYATISVGKRADVGEVLITEGLASLQFHRDGEVRSSRYDELSAAEAEARKAKKNLHSGKDAGVRKVRVRRKRGARSEKTRHPLHRSHIIILHIIPPNPLLTGE
jgi:staphylococcal nuclease domain-containing protein 1